MSDYQVKTRVRLFREEEPSFGPGIARMMELVDEYGSMARACREMNMAYSKGYKIVKRAEEDLGIILMTGTKGGKNGGGMELTKEGRDLLIRYRGLEKELNQELKILYEKYFD